MKMSHIFILLQFAFYLSFSIFQMSFHNFSISFSKSSSQSTSSSLPTHFHSHTKNSGSHMFNRRQLNLKFCLSIFSMFIKNFQNQIHSISYLKTKFFKLFIDIIYLFWLENISDNQDSCSHSFHIFDNFFQLS